MTVSRIRHAEDALWHLLPSGILALPQGRRDPILLAGTAAALWVLMAEPRTVAEIATVLANRYRVEIDEVERSIGPVVEELKVGGLVVEVP